MIENDEIIIDDEIINEYQSKLHPSKKETKENISKNENSNDKNQIEIEHYNNINKIIEDENIENNNKDDLINDTHEIKNNFGINNHINNEINDIKRISDINKNNDLLGQIHSTEKKENNIDTIINSKNENSNISNRRDSTHINGNATISKKEESIQKFIESNFQNKNNNDQKNILLKSNNIYDENEEYKSIDNILNYKNYKNQRNINNNNNNKKLYFTETNIQGSTLKNNSQKSSTTISSIQEYSKKMRNEISSPLTILIEEPNKKIRKKNINYKLNNLSPKIYMKKKFVNKYNFHPLQFRIKRIEEEVEKQNNYYFQKAMKDLQIKFDKEKKNKEKQKHIFELHKKLEEKLKFMEEKRNILYNEKLNKIMQKQNLSSNKDNNKNNLKKKSEKSYTNRTPKKKVDINNNIKTIDSYNSNNDKKNKLPLIENMSRNELIKLMKEKNEEEFCLNTIKQLKENEINHRNNHIRQLNIINNNLLKKNKLYKQRSERCIIVNRKKELELENYLQKDILKRYNIKEILSRERSAKKEKYKENIMKNYEGVKEKKELIEKGEEKKIKEIIKKLNKNIKRDINENNERLLFSNLQKENYNKCNEDNNIFYNEILMKQEKNIMIVNELQKEEPNTKQEIIKRTLEEQNQKMKQLKSLDKFLDKMDKKIINNQSEETKIKVFKQIKKEKKEKEDELLQQ